MGPMLDGGSVSDDDGERPSLAREIRCEEIADLLGLKGTHKRRLENARRLLKRIGIARQHGPRGPIFTTMGDLREHAAHLWAEAIRRNH